MNTPVRQNLFTYLAFVLIAVVGLFYGRSIAADHTFLRVWDLPAVLVLLVGIPFLFVQRHANLPDFWEPNIGNKRRFLYPALIGIAFGLLDILVMKVILHPEPYTDLPPFLQPFPYSLFLYFSGAFEVEIFYRLIPLTLILMLGQWYKQGKYFQAFFWVAAILTSLREPIEQLPTGSTAIIIYSLLTGFLMNLLQAIWYRKAGFLASLAVRLGHYLFWHILLGLYVEYVELG